MSIVRCEVLKLRNLVYRQEPNRPKEVYKCFSISLHRLSGHRHTNGPRMEDDACRSACCLTLTVGKEILFQT